MSAKINLKSIRKYNPGLLKDDDVIANFIARQKTFKKLLDHLIQEAKDSIPQHHIIIGQRGMGKTTLLKRIEVELRLDPKLTKKYAPLQYPEEQYNIDRLSKFWLNTIDVLIDYLEITNRKNLVAEYDKKMQSVTKISEESQLSESAYNLFLEIIKKIKRRAVLLIDNIDELFAGLNDEEQWQLREKLSKPSAPIFVGASASPFDSIFEYKQAFYDYFKITILEPLNSKDFHSLLSTLAASIENEKIKQSFQQNKNRIEALYRLAGGNIRTAIILFSSLHNGFGDNVGEDLEKLLDEATPIYKARIEELSDQLKTIIDAIALHWHPIDLQNLREATSLENNTLSPQVRRLRKLGWITKTASNKTKGGKYEMTERFFNVWYLMRRTTRRHKRDITCLSRFFEEYFGAHGDKHARTLLSKPIQSSKDVTYGLAISEIIQDKALKEELLQYTRQGLSALSDNDPNILFKFNIPLENANLTITALKLIEERKYQEAEKEYLKILKIETQNANIWNDLGDLYRRNLGNYNKAKNAYLKAIELDDRFASPWNGLGNLYQKLNDEPKALDAYLKAIDLDDKSANPWNGLGNLYQKLNDKSKALEAYLKAIDLDNEFAHPWNNLGNLYQKLNDDSKALEAYLKAIELDDSSALPRNGLGNLYQQLNDNAKALDTYLKAIELDNEYAHPWHNLGRLYHYNLKDYSKAKKAYLKAIELDAEFAHPWNGLGNLYQYHLDDYSKAEEAYLKAIELDKEFANPWNGLGNLFQYHLDDYSKAEEAYLKAIELDKEFANPWNGLGNLYQDHLKNYSKAEEAYHKAIALDNDFAYPWNGLGNLYQDHLKNYSKAEEAYHKAIALDNDFAYPWNGLGNLYQNHLNDDSKAQEAYLKAIELDDEFAHPWNNLGGLYQYHLKNYTLAKKAYLKAIELDDEFANPWSNLGDLYQHHLENYSLAKKAYLKAIELDDEFANPWNGLGYYYHEHLNDHSKAKEAYLKSIKLNENYESPWNGLGYLYHYYFKEYSKAKEAYLKSIELNNKYTNPWNNLGNLYHDQIGDFNKAKNAYFKVLELDLNDIVPKYNLLNLLRDILNQYDDAKNIFESLTDNSEGNNLDIYFLNESLFHIYDNNFGLADSSLITAIKRLNDKMPDNTFIGWQRYVAVAVDLGFGEDSIRIFKEKGIDILMRPFFEASIALQNNDDFHFQDIAAELRETSKEIYEFMKKYKSNLYSNRIK